MGADSFGNSDPQGLAACKVNFPDMPIDTGLGFSTTNIGGHAGVLTYDARGKTEYFEYGRYPAGDAIGVVFEAKSGNVRQRTTMRLKLGSDGKPTPESFAALSKQLEALAGKNTRAELQCDDNADERKVKAYVYSVAKDPERPKYSWKPWNSFQCRDFSNNAFNAGR